MQQVPRLQEVVIERQNSRVDGKRVKQAAIWDAEKALGMIRLSGSRI
jgi:hypothetical protein